MNTINTTLKITAKIQNKVDTAKKNMLIYNI